jgi:hypothetical protein
MTNFHWVDIVCIFSANLFNLAVIGIMLARPFKREGLEFALGLVSVSLSVPLLLSAVYNFTQPRSIWLGVLPGLLGVFCLIELFLDYVFKIPFRQTRWIGPYLLVFYAAQWGMIGFGFIISEAAGFITLFTYFLSLAATAYSYKQIGHGPASGQPAER